MALAFLVGWLWSRDQGPSGGAGNLARPWLHLEEEVEAVGHQRDEGELDDEAAMVTGA